MTILPMTSDEAAAFLKGVAWAIERSAKHADDQREIWQRVGAPDCAYAAMNIREMIRAIPAPTVPRLGFGVLGEG